MFAEFFQLFGEYIKVSSEISGLIKSKSSSVYVPESELTNQRPYHYVVSAINDIWYRDEQSPLETRRYIGMVNLGSNVHLADLLNEIKASLQKQYKLIRESGTGSRLYESHEFKRVLKKCPRPDEFKRHGISRICTNHLFRKLIVVHEPVSSISFTIEKHGWTEQEIQREALLKRIERDFSESSKYTEYRDKILSEPLDSKFIVAYPQKPSVRANIKMLSSGARRTPRVAMPIFLGDNSVLPRTNLDFKFNPKADHRLSRSDRLRSTIPLIENTNYYLSRSK